MGTGHVVSSGEVPILVILVQYKDVKFTHPSPSRYFGDLLGKEGFSEYGGTGSALDYFRKQSQGKFTPRFDLTGPITLPQSRSYYGANTTSGADKAPEEMVVDAAKALDAGIDFAQYDVDKDGKVDNVIIVYAGQGESSYGTTNTVWPHSGFLSEKKKTLTLDGVTIDRYTCINEWDDSRPVGLGVFAREIAHSIGLPELGHSTDQGAAFTPGPWSLMDEGCYNNDGCTPPNLSAFERYMLGWLQPVVLDGPDAIILGNLESTNAAYMIRTEREQEFFMLENRRQTGWDSYLPSHGMLIWHIDRDEAVFAAGTVNDLREHQYVDIVEACGDANSQHTPTLEGYTWPGTSGNDTFTSTSTPALMSWGGRGINLPLTDIRENEDGTVSFNVSGGIPALPSPEGLSASVQQGGKVLLKWESVEAASGYLLDLTSTAEGESIIKDLSCEGTEFLTEALEAGKSYEFTVRASIGRHVGAASEGCTFTVQEPSWGELRPEIVAAAEFADGGFIARWEPMAGAVDYILDIEADLGAGEECALVDFGHTGSMTMALPAGWAWNGSEKDLYYSNSTGFYGESAPALKFNADGNTLTSPVFDNPVSGIRFWQRGASVSSESTLRIEGQRGDDDKWISLYSLHPCTEDGGLTVDFEPAHDDIRRVRFYYDRILGNMAFDDLEVRTFGSVPEPIANLTGIRTGAQEEYAVTLEEPFSHTYYYSVRAVNAEGQETLPSARGKVRTPAWASSATVEVAGASLSVSGRTVRGTLPSGGVMVIYNSTGLAIARAAADASGAAEVTLAAPGLYIAVCGGRTMKVVVR